MCLKLKSEATVEKGSFIQFGPFILQNFKLFFKTQLFYIICNIYKKCTCKNMKIIKKFEKIVCKYLK